MLREAVAEKDHARAEHLFNAGANLLRERIKNDSDKEIHILSLVERQLDWAQRCDLTAEQRLHVLQDAEMDLDGVRSRYPTSSDIATVAAKLNIQLEQVPDAKKLLFRGIQLDGSNSRARILLAKILLREQDEQGAYNLVEEGLAYSPRSYGLLRIRLDATRLLHVPWPQLRKVLTDYIAVAENDVAERVHLIAGLIEALDFATAKKQLEHLKRVDAPYNLKRKSIVDVMKDGNPLVVEGEFMPRALGKGFVNIFGFPPNMGAYMDMRTLSGTGVSLQAGKRIQIQLAVNGLGLVARRIV